MGQANCYTSVQETVAKRRLLLLSEANVECLGEKIPAVAADALLLGGCPSLATVEYTLAKQTSDALCGLQAQIDDFVAGTQYVTEVHFTATDDGKTGNGSFDNPFRYGGQASFDAQIAALPAGTAIRLEAGTFETNGLVLKNAMPLRGRGRGVTTLKLANNAATSGDKWVAFAGYNLTYAEVSDLTIDCNLANQPLATGEGSGSINAVGLICTQGRIERVDVLGIYSGGVGEGFPVAIVAQTSSTASAPTVAVIRDVKVLEPKVLESSGATVIAATNQTGGILAYNQQHGVCVIENCQIGSAVTSKAVGFGAGGWEKAVIRNNYTNGIGTFMIQDTLVARDVEVSSNRAVGLTTYFVNANGSNANQYLNYRIINNISQAKAGSETTLAHLLLNFDNNTSLVVEGNVFDSGTETLPFDSYYVFNVTAAQGVIRNNWVSPNLSLRSGAFPSAGVLTIGNRYFDGWPMTDTATQTNVRETWYVEGSVGTAGTVVINLGEFASSGGAEFIVNGVIDSGGAPGNNWTIQVNLRESGQVYVRVLGHAADVLVAGANLPLFYSKLNATTGYYALYLTCVLAAAGTVKANVTGTPLRPSTLAYGSPTTAYNTYDALVAPPRSTPTVAGGAGAGVGATVTIAGNSVAGQITVLTAGTPSAGGVIATVSFGTGGNWPNAPKVTLTPASLTAGNFAGTGTPWISGEATTGFVVNAPTTALTTATTYVWNYAVHWPFNT